jgi:hypothetical protein
VTGTGVDLGKSYVSFVRNNMDTIAKRITDDLWVLNIMEVGEERTDSSDFDFCFMRKSYFSEMVFRPSSNAEHMAD